MFRRICTAIQSDETGTEELSMKKKKNPRGLFERPPGSGVWWINYYVNGKQHREKVGRKSAAIDLYRKRKEDDRSGRKLPTLRNTAIVTISELDRPDADPRQDSAP